VPSRPGRGRRRRPAADPVEPRSAGAGPLPRLVPTGEGRRGTVPRRTVPNRGSNASPGRLGRHRPRVPSRQLSARPSLRALRPHGSPGGGARSPSLPTQEVLLDNAPPRSRRRTGFSPPPERVSGDLREDPILPLPSGSLLSEDDLGPFLSPDEPTDRALIRGDPDASPGAQRRIVEAKRAPLGDDAARLLVQGTPDVLNAGSSQDPTEASLARARGFDSLPSRTRGKDRPIAHELTEKHEPSPDGTDGACGSQSREDPATIVHPGDHLPIQSVRHAGAPFRDRRGARPPLPIGTGAGTVPPGVGHREPSPVPRVPSEGRGSPLGRVPRGGSSVLGSATPRSVASRLGSPERESPAALAIRPRRIRLRFAPDEAPDRAVHPVVTGSLPYRRCGAVRGK
jgi:hypothetical protein